MYVLSVYFHDKKVYKIYLKSKKNLLEQYLGSWNDDNIAGGVLVLV